MSDEKTVLLMMSLMDVENTSVTYHNPNLPVHHDISIAEWARMSTLFTYCSQQCEVILIFFLQAVQDRAVFIFVKKIPQKLGF